jgi:hypothetical protein
MVAVSADGPVHGRLYSLLHGAAVLQMSRNCRSLTVVQTMTYEL